MKLFRTLSTGLLLCGIMTAAPIFRLLSDEDLKGSPGETIPIQFEITSDNDFWISVIGSTTLNETNPLLGIYEDLTYTQGGPTGILLSVNGPAFSGLLGTYTIDPSAPIGALNSGSLALLIEIFSDNPLTCGDCLIGSSSNDTANFTVEVVPTPEPATIGISAAVLAGLYLRRRSL